MTTRLSYQFKFVGKTYTGHKVDVGESSNPNWFKDESGKGKRFHKWSAICHELPDLYDAMIHAGDEGDIYIVELNPLNFGFKFVYIYDGE